MKNIILYFGFVVLIIGMFGFAFANVNSDEPAGKKAFIDNKCNSCHPIEAAGITTKAKKNNPDLSKVGKELTPDAMIKYIKKETKINDKKHPSNWKGTDEDLKAITDWLGTLK